MDIKTLQNISLNNSMNSNDLNILSKLFDNSKKNNNKMSVKDKNNIINQLTSSSFLNELPQKDLKDMNEQEKKIYRDQLRLKLKNKQGQYKMLRTNNIAKNKNIPKDMNKLSDIIKNFPLTSDTNTNINMDTNTNINMDTNTNMDTNISTNTNMSTNTNTNMGTTKLQDVEKINNIINNKYDDINSNIDDNLDDYIC